MSGALLDLRTTRRALSEARGKQKLEVLLQAGALVRSLPAEELYLALLDVGPDDAAEMISALDRALATSLADLECMRIAARQRVRGLTPDYVADRMVDVVRHVS